MKQKLFIPFDDKGNLLSYVYNSMTDDEKEICQREGHVDRDNGSRVITFVTNYEFSDTMTFDGFSRGRSSVKAHFTSEATGKKYEMFISDFEDAIKTGEFREGRIEGKFTFVKKGENYGLALVGGKSDG